MACFVRLGYLPWVEARRGHLLLLVTTCHIIGSDPCTIFGSDPNDGAAGESGVPTSQGLTKRPHLPALPARVPIGNSQAMRVDAAITPQDKDLREAHGAGCRASAWGKVYAESVKGNSRL